MAYLYSKGWYIQQLKAIGISKFEQKKLELYKTHVIANLYRIHIKGKEKEQ